MSNSRRDLHNIWNRRWLNLSALLMVFSIIFLFVFRAAAGDVHFVTGAYPAISTEAAPQSPEVVHESFELISSFASQGVAGDATVVWTIPVELNSDVQAMTVAIFGTMFPTQIAWDGEVIGGVRSFREDPAVASTRGNLLVTLPSEQSMVGAHELKLTVVGQHGEGRMTGELSWGTRAEVISHYRYLRFLTYMIEGTFAVLSITFTLIAALGYKRDEFFIWGWFFFTMCLVTPAFSGLWDLFSDSEELQHRLQFAGLVLVPISTVLRPAWMIGIHRRKIIYLPVLVVSVIGALVGATFDLRVLVYLRDWVGVLALVVVVMTFIWVNYLAVKGNREARFFVFEALILGVGAITGILATLGLMRDYQLMMPCAVVSSSAVAVYFIVRHSGLANRYATLVKSSGDGIVVIDRGGRIREANLAAKTMLGGQLGLFKDLLRSSDHDLFHEHVFGSRLGRREEFRLLDETDGTVVESISVKLTDGTTLLSLRDIRERMELELGMAQAARIEATELVVIELARDLRECVASIYGSAETIKQACNKGKAKDRFKKFLDVLRRCSDLGDQLSMLASGVGVEPQEFLIDNALSDLLDSLSEGLGDKISVVPQLGASGVLVRGVVQEIESVFVNLIFNSRDAMGEDGGTVWVDSAVRAGFVEISFEDDGPGIPDELWSRVWEPFFSTKEAGQGGGVGLSVVARVLRRHRGNYRVEYGGRAGGARIVVSLPVVSRVS